ncbi:hypothetical protein Avbf_10021, partial [Armadillidium vulgare]
CLAAALCFIGGTLFGYLIGSKTVLKTDVMKAFNESCTNAQVLPNSTTITTTTETPVRSDPFYPKGLSFGGPDINELVSDFLSNFTPALYNKYAR